MTDGRFISDIDKPFLHFTAGFRYPFRAARFLWAHPGLLRYILIPFAINVLVFSAAVFFGLDLFSEVAAHIPRGEAWYWSLLFYFFWLLAVLLTAVLVFFAFTVLGNLIASPFNDLLSERTEEFLAGRKNDEAFSWRAFWRNAWRVLVEETKKIGLFVLGMGLLLLLNLVPIAGTILFAVLSGLFTLFFLVVEYTGFVFGRKQATFRTQRQFIFARKFLMLGFGSGVLALLAVPFLQFLCIPVSVVGATQLWFDEAGPASGKGRELENGNKFRSTRDAIS